MDDTMEIEIDGRMVETPLRPIDAGDVIALAGMPGGLVIRIDGCRALQFVPDEPVAFGADLRLAFRTFPGGKIRQLRVGGLLWDWGAPAITEDEVRAIADIGEDEVLHLHGVDEPIRRGGVIDLTTTWPPQIEIRDAAPVRAQGGAVVPVVVNGRSITLDRPEVTFEDLVGLAFPGSDLSSPGTRALTVTYRRGPPARPEGSLVSRERVQVRQGEVFNVTSTDKS